MPAWGEALVAIACLVGIIGVVVPVLPGDHLVGAAILVWALVEQSACRGWSPAWPSPRSSWATC